MYQSARRFVKTIPINVTFGSEAATLFGFHPGAFFLIAGLFDAVYRPSDWTV